MFPEYRAVRQDIDIGLAVVESVGRKLKHLEEMSIADGEMAHLVHHANTLWHAFQCGFQPIPLNCQFANKLFARAHRLVKFGYMRAGTMNGVHLRLSLS